MSEEVQRNISVSSSHDDELDAINLALVAILEIAPAEARERIVQYLAKRFIKPL